MLPHKNNHSRKSRNNNIAILGTGSWGNTLAILLSKTSKKVKMWTVSKKELDQIKRNNAFLKPKKFKLPKEISISNDLKEVIKNVSLIVIAVPSSAFKETILKLAKVKIEKKIILLSATKGFINSYSRPSEIMKKYLRHNRYGVLSGPNIAFDVISNTPVISVVSAKNKEAALFIQKTFNSNHFRVYINPDTTSVEISGALKNVIAIAAGISDGLNFNISTKAGLISRGLNEITKIAIKEGGKAKSMLGAASIGDLIATCCSPKSRNYQVGYMLAKGKRLSYILRELGQVAEGAETVKAMVKLGKKYKVETPIASAVYDIVIDKKDPKSIIKKLLERPIPKNELDF